MLQSVKNQNGGLIQDDGEKNAKWRVNLNGEFIYKISKWCPNSRWTSKRFYD
jgi:hypothetical protein